MNRNSIVLLIAAVFVVGLGSQMAMQTPDKNVIVGTGDSIEVDYTYHLVEKWWLPHTTDVRITAESDELGYEEEVYNSTMEQGTYHNSTFTYDIPENTEPGNYTIKVRPEYMATFILVSGWNYDEGFDINMEVYESKSSSDTINLQFFEQGSGKVIGFIQDVFSSIFDRLGVDI